MIEFNQNNRKTIEKYILLALKPKIPQRSNTFRRRQFIFLDPTNTQMPVHPK
jgi:hypothetical protein